MWIVSQLCSLSASMSIETHFHTKADQIFEDLKQEDDNSTNGPTNSVTFLEMVKHA